MVDAGSVLMAMGTQGELTVFEPSAQEYKKITSYKVAQTETYAYPVPMGEGVLIKDKDALALWTAN